MFTGSYRVKDWYARDPRGQRFYYDTGRFMTCWLYPQWLVHLEQMVRGTEGVFFDNPWYGCQTLHLGGAYTQSPLFKLPGQAALIANTSVALLLLPIGLLGFAEKFAIQHVVGVILCLAGLILLNIK